MLSISREWQCAEFRARHRLRPMRIGGLKDVSGLASLRPSFHREDLLDDFIRREVAFPAVKPAGAEFAAVGAADLGGNAERVAVAGLAVKRGIGGNQHAFDERMVVQPPEKFLRGVARALLCGRVPAYAVKSASAQFFPQRFRQICHRLPVRRAAGVKPFEQLRDAVSRLVPLLELRLQFFAGHGFDVSPHFFRLNGSGRNT